MTDDQRQTDPGVLRRLLGADGPELSCEQCFAQLDRYVELELGGEDADAGVPEAPAGRLTPPEVMFDVRDGELATPSG
jgi:hypothetical protein